MDSFAGKTAIVTGATRGIGKAVAEAFARRGATVIGTYSGNREAAERVRRQVLDEGLSLEVIRCDVSDHTAVATFYEEIEDRFDSLDILVNNAGIRRDALTALMDLSKWRDVIDTNLTGAFLMAKRAVPLMLRHKFGRIVTVTSPAAYLGIQGQANYAASKAGQIGFTRTLAKEVARKKITVNCVSPGFIQTDFISDLPDSQIATYKKMIPMRRFGTATEVADVILFLASEQASYITGATIEVTGGL